VTPPDQQAALEAFVERALHDSTESEVRFNLRQALQLLSNCDLSSTNERRE
jgi:hypothetical protein